MSSNNARFNDGNINELSKLILTKGNNIGEDGNSSTETLSAEERHTISHMQRQEPQGEERVKIFSSPSFNPSAPSFNSSDIQNISDSTSCFVPSCHNNDSNSSISSNSNTNTLIIHRSVPQESWSNQWMSGCSSKLRESSAPPPSSIASSYDSYLHNTLLSDDLLSTCSSQAVTNILLNSSIDSSSPYTGTGNCTYLGKNCSFYVNGSTTPKYSSNSTEIPDIPSSYLDQSEVLKHLINKNAKETIQSSCGGLLATTSGLHGTGSTTASGAFSESNSSSSSAINYSQVDRGSVSGSSSHGSQYISGLLDRDDGDLNSLLYRLDHLNPPPAYTAWQGDRPSLKNTTESQGDKTTLLSKSQPDLTRIGIMKEYSPSNAKDYINSRFAMTCIENEENPAFLKELVDILTRENSTIKVELDICRRKVAKLQKFEMQMTIVEQQYEALVKGCERREQLEKLARHKLQAELKKLTDINNELRDKLEASKMHATPEASPSVSSDGTAFESSSSKKELNKRDVIIAQLISQNKELTAAKERQSMELTAQRQTLNEQRTHIDILDSAFRNAQANILKLEEEVRKKQSLVEQAGQFKRLLLSVKLASDRRERSEKNLRQKLEMEILQLKSNAEMDRSSSSELECLRREIQQKNQKILSLESQSAEREQPLAQELTWLQSNLDGAAIGKNAKENIAMGKNTVGNHQISSSNCSDELESLKNKIAMLEARNRNLESYSSESEAVIKGLQRQIKDFESCRPEMHQKSFITAGNDSSSVAPCYSTASPATLTHARHKSESTVPQKPPHLASFLPRRDEELGKLSLLLAPSSPTTQQYSIRPFVSHDLPSPTDKSSQSGYCCYVTTSSSFDASSYKANEHSLDKIPSKIVRGDSDSSHRVPSKDQDCNLSTAEASSKDSSSMGDISLAKNDCDSLPSISLSSSVDSSVGSNPPPPYYSPHQVMSRGISQEDSATVISSPSIRGQAPTPRPSYLSQHSDSSPKVTNSPQFIYTANSSVVGPTTLPPPSPPLPKMVPACQKLHPPNAFCRTCLSVRRSHRQNAAAFFRRANLNSCPHNRRSAPSPVSTGDSFDDAPSILERLKKEWQMGSLSSYNQNDDSEAAPEQPSKCQSDVTTPYVTQTPAAQISEGNVNLNEIKCKQSQLRASSRRREPSCERKVDYGTPNDSPGKRDVTDLDKALNKLSFKRNASNQTHAKPPCVPSNHSRTFYNAVVSEVHNTSERSNVPFNPTSDQGITIKVAHTVDKENGNADSMVNDGTDRVNCN